MKTLNLDVHFEFVKDEAVSLPRQNQEHGAGTYFSVMTFIQVLVLSHRPLELRAVTFEIWSWNILQIVAKPKQQDFFFYTKHQDLTHYTFGTTLHALLLALTIKAETQLKSLYRDYWLTWCFYLEGQKSKRLKNVLIPTAKNVIHQNASGVWVPLISCFVTEQHCCICGTRVCPFLLNKGL